MTSPRTLGGRLALWYAAVLSIVLIAFAATIYLVIEADEADEPPIVAALEPPDHTGRHVLVTLAIALPIALAVAIAGGVLITRRSLRGLVEVTRAAQGLDETRLHQRIAERGDDVVEVAQLTAALNAMLARVEGSVAGVRRFTEDASHELRTPIAALMGEIEVTLRKPREPAVLRSALESALEELGDISRLLDALLTLARSDSGQLRLQPEDVDVCALVARIVAPYEVLASDRAVTLEVVRNEALRAFADPLWIGRAIGNVLDNAIKFTPSGGRVSVTTERDGELVAVVVRDSGPGVAAEEREKIFERFFRSTSTAADVHGFGLGLALARDIAHASGGDLVVQQEGETGATFRFSLPER